MIVEKDTEKFYFGLKNYWSIIKKKPGKYRMKERKYVKDKNGKRVLETRTTKKHIRKESDWRTYNSSRPELVKKIKENPNNYEKHIIRNCKSKSELKAYEAYCILNCYFEKIYWNKCYNECIEGLIK